MPDPTIYAIPMDFYGGKNAPPPQLGAGGVPLEKTPEPVAASRPAPPVERQPVLPAQPTMVKPIAAPSSNKKWIIGGVVVVVIILLAAGGFLFWQQQTQAPVATAPAPVVITEATSTAAQIATSTEEIATSTIAFAAPTSTPALIPAHVYRDSADSDGDGLTDVEEEMWNTNPALIDSDNDGYPDRLELLNLYNPAAPSPVRLIDGAAVSTYVNPDFNYSVYHPNAWVARAVDETTHKEVLFSALSGEFVQIMVLPFPSGQAFPDWFHQNFPNENLITYQPFVNRFKVSGIISPDKTVAFISDGSNVYLLRYDGGTREEINYRTTFLMMVQSFKPAGVATPLELLPQTQLGVPTALGELTTTTPEIIIPETALTATTTPATTTSPSAITTSTKP